MFWRKPKPNPLEARVAELEAELKRARENELAALKCAARECTCREQVKILLDQKRMFTEMLGRRSSW